MTGWSTDQAASGSLALAIPVALLAGLVSFFSPCVIPLLPGSSYATGLSGADLENARRGRMLAGRCSSSSGSRWCSWPSARRPARSAAGSSTAT